MLLNSDNSIYCPRLIDYLVFVSRKGHSSSEAVYNQTPSLLKCYPFSKHQDFDLPNDVVYFCQPEGCLSSALSSTYLGTTTFVFTLTDKDAQKTRFGICLNFYRSCCISDSMHLNENNTSNWSLNSTHNEPPDEYVLMDNNKQSLLTSLCLVSHHPFFSKFRQCLHSLKEIIDRCDEYFKNVFSAKNKFYSFWSTFLTNGFTEQRKIDNESLTRVVYEIESWIINLLNAPVPIPGKTCLHLSVGPEALYEKLVFALPDKTRLTLIDFPLHLPLELLGMETCLKVLTAIMLEQKVVLQSRDYNALTMSVMAFTAMLYPLQYMFPAIPLLPNSLEGGENLLLSPTPFLIGIPATFLSQKTDFRFPADVWLVDLDTNKMMGSSLLESIPPLPEKEGELLCENLQQALSSMTANFTPDESADVDSKNSTNNLNSADFADVAARVAMVRFFNSLNILGNITEHTRTIRLFPRPVVAFQKFSFLKSRQILTPFIKKLAQTQAVEFFAEWCLYPENEVYQRIHAGIHDPEQIGDKVDIENFEVVHENFPKLTNPIKWDLNSFYDPPKDLSDLLKNAIQPQQHIRKNKPKRRPDQQIQQMDSFDSVNVHSQKTSATDDYNEMNQNKKKLPGPMYSIPSIAESSSDSSDDQDDSDIWDLKSSLNQSGMNSNTNTYEDDLIRDSDNLHVYGADSGHMLMNTSNASILRKPSLRNVSTTETTTNQQIIHTNEMHKRSVHYNEEQLVQVLNKDENGSSLYDDTEKKDVSEEDVEEDYDDDDMEQTSVGKYLFNNLSDNLADAASHASTKLSGLLNKPKAIVRKSGNLMKKMATEMATGAISDLKSTDTTSTSINVKKSMDVNNSHKASDGDFIQSASKFVFNLPRKQLFHFGANKSRHQEELTDKMNSFKGSDLNIVNPEQSHADQEFLRELVQYIHEGQPNVQTKFSASRLRELLSDENYRNYLLSKLNCGLSQSFDDPDECIPDVSIINIDGYKAYIWLLQCIIRGLEQTCTNHGIGGLASAMMLLELCHTQYLNIRTTASPVKLQGSQNSANERLQEEENLVTAFTGWLRTTTNDLKKVTKPNLVTGLFSRPNPSENLNNNKGQSVDSSFTKRNQQFHQLNSSNNFTAVIEQDYSGSMSNDAVFGRKSRHAGSYRFIHGNLIDLSDGNHCSTLATDNHNNSSNVGNNEKSSISNYSFNRIYLYENLIDGNERSRLWDHMQFWEDTFFDTVAQERDILGLDQAPMETIEHFAHMNATQKRIVLLKEDRLLALCLYNLTAYMTSMNVDKGLLVNNVRRLLARCRIGSYFGATVNHLLDSIKYLNGNSIDLLPPMTRLRVFQSYEIEMLDDLSKEAKILEAKQVCHMIETLIQKGDLENS
ncbi:MAP kinase-activating death domain protein [Schistosoma japonicum]|nr:MAP kinase-activating death domain protein [Schistosoma japonicum]